MSKTYDYLPNHPDITVVQDDEMFRINTDTKVLGEFLEIYKNDSVLDIGTNNGALLLYASLFSPKKLIGIDLNKEALLLAKENMDNNKITNCTLLNADANTYVAEEVDVIICNPPYFKTRPIDRGQNKYLALAKHEDNLPLQNLILTIQKNLKNNGTLFMLFQTSRLYEILNLLEQHKMKIKKLKFVYDAFKDTSNVFLIKAVKGGKPGVVVEKPIIITR